MIAIQDVHAAVGVDGLRLLVREARALGDREGDDPRRRRQDALAAAQVRDHVSLGTGAPDGAAVRGPRVAHVAVVGGRVGPRLRLVLRVARVVPARVRDEVPVHPGRVQRAAVGRGVEAVDVRVVPDAFEMRAEERVGSHRPYVPVPVPVRVRIRVRPRFRFHIRRRAPGGRVHAEMIVAQPGLAGAEGEQEIRPSRLEARVRDVAQQVRDPRRRRREPRERRNRRRE